MIAFLLLLLPYMAFASQTIAEAATGSNDLSTLVSALPADLVTALGDTSASLTVFAPVNTAFSMAMGSGTVLDAFTALSTADQTDLLQYHVVGSEISAAAALASNGASIETLNGDRIHVNSNGSDKVWINGVEVTGTIECSNGVVHTIGEVLFPPAYSIATAAENTPDLSTLFSLVGAAELASTLAGPANFTVFAPTNAAFDALETAVPGVTACLSAAENKAVLQDVLTYHVLDAIAYSPSLSSMMVTMLNGDMADIVVSGSGVMVESANVVDADITVTNGVVHVIDAVLVPPGFECETMSSSSMSMSGSEEMSSMMSSDATFLGMSALIAAF